MKDRIEHTEHRTQRARETTTWSFGERRYGRAASPSATGNGPSVAAASPAGEAEASTAAASSAGEADT